MAVITRRFLRASAKNHLKVPYLFASYPTSSHLGMPMAIPQHFSCTAPKSQMVNTCGVTLKNGKWESTYRFFFYSPTPHGDHSKMYIIKLLRQSGGQVPSHF